MPEEYSPRMNHDSAAYWRGVSAKTLLLAHCKSCDHWIHPPRACCPACWSDDIEHRSPSGQWTLCCSTVQAGAGGRPLILGWVELVEQQRLLLVAPLVDIAPDAIKIGAKLHLDWLPFQNTFVPTFRQENAQ